MQHVWAHASGAEGSLSAHMVGLASSDQGRTAGRSRPAVAMADPSPSRRGVISRHKRALDHPYAAARQGGRIWFVGQGMTA
jgi:hypothetical protein